MVAVWAFIAYVWIFAFCEDLLLGEQCLLMAAYTNNGLAVWFLLWWNVSYEAARRDYKEGHANATLAAEEIKRGGTVVFMREYSTPSNTEWQKKVATLYGPDYPKAPPLHINEVITGLMNKESGQMGSDDTALLTACEKGHWSIVSLLLATGEADVNLSAPDDGATPLLLAAEYGHATIVSMLLQHRPIHSHKPTPYPLPHTGRLHPDEPIPRPLLPVDVNLALTSGDGAGVTPLWAAAVGNHPIVVTMLMGTEGIDVNKARTKDGTTALYAACERGHAKVVSVLLSLGMGKGIDLHRGPHAHGMPLTTHEDTDTIPTPLWIAAWNGHLAVVGMLVTQPGIDVDLVRKRRIINKSGATELLTPYDAAVRRGHTTTAEVLLAYVHRHGKKFQDNKQAVRSSQEELGSKLKSHNDTVLADIQFLQSLVEDERTENETDSLEDAATIRTKMSKFVMALSSAQQLLVLIMAASIGKAKVVSAIVDYGTVDVNARAEHGLFDVEMLGTDSYTGQTALSIATMNGEMEVVVELLRAPGIDPNIGLIMQASSGDQDMRPRHIIPLMLAVGKQQLEMAKVLLNHPHIDVNRGVHAIPQEVWESDTYRCTAMPEHIKLRDGCGAALLAVAALGHIDMVRLLLSRPDIDVNAAAAKTAGGAFPLAEAASQGHATIVAEMLRHPEIDVNKRRMDTRATALFDAAQAGHVDVVRLLVAVADCDVNAFSADKPEYTPLNAAVLAGHEGVVRALVEARGGVRSKEVNADYNDLDFHVRYPDTSPGAQASDFSTLDLAWLAFVEGKKGRGMYDVLKGTGRYDNVVPTVPHEL